MQQLELFEILLKEGFYTDWELVPYDFQKLFNDMVGETLFPVTGQTVEKSRVPAFQEECDDQA
jgi:hypothetical protein